VIGTQVWEWSEVSRWLSEQGMEGVSTSEDADFVAAVNGELQSHARLHELGEPEREMIASFARRNVAELDRAKPSGVEHEPATRALAAFTRADR
jgi:hypothetical protein